VQYQKMTDKKVLIQGYNGSSHYRILRESSSCIIGEIYLYINMNLMVIPRQKLSDTTEMHSHPMALYQFTALKNIIHIKKTQFQTLGIYNKASLPLFKATAINNVS